MSGPREEAAPIRRLHFIYNADFGLASAFKDFWHKLLRPETYPCRLCDLTYGVATMKPRWRRFVDALPHPVSFGYRDRFTRTHPEIADTAWPAALAEGTDGALRLWISAEEMNACTSLEELMALVQRKL